MSTPETSATPEVIKPLKTPKYSIGSVVRYTNGGLTIIAAVKAVRQQIITKTKGDSEWFYFLDSPITQQAVPESMLAKL